jgi:hypothetical protein
MNSITYISLCCLQQIIAFLTNWWFMLIFSLCPNELIFFSPIKNFWLDWLLPVEWDLGVLFKWKDNTFYEHHMPVYLHPWIWGIVAYNICFPLQQVKVAWGDPVNQKISIYTSHKYFSTEWNIYERPYKRKTHRVNDQQSLPSHPLYFISWSFFLKWPSPA